MTKQRKTTQKCLMLVFLFIWRFCLHREKNLLVQLQAQSGNFYGSVSLNRVFWWTTKKTNQKKNNIVVKYSETLTCPVDIDKFEEINLFGQEDIWSSLKQCYIKFSVFKQKLKGEAICSKSKNISSAIIFFWRKNEYTIGLRNSAHFINDSLSFEMWFRFSVIWASCLYSLPPPHTHSFSVRFWFCVFTAL